MDQVLVVTRFRNNVEARRRISPPQAFNLMLREPTGLLVPHDADLVEVRSVTQTFLVPLVIVLFPAATMPVRPPRVSKDGIYRRDNGMCGYCGKKLLRPEATVDHIHPESRGGETSWVNLVCACRKCNTKKADLTPREAGMKLLIKPYAPKHHGLFN